MACHFRKFQLPLQGLKIKMNKEPNFYKMFIYILYIISTSNTNYKNTTIHNYTVDTIFVQVSSSLKLDGVLKAIKKKLSFFLKCYLVRGYLVVPPPPLTTHSQYLNTSITLQINQSPK